MKLLPAALVAALSAVVVANDASFVGDGATIYASKENRVRMVRERVDIKWGAKLPREWRADCEFEFESLSDEPVSITMGFPNWYGWGDAVGANPQEFAISDFQARVDGRAVATEAKVIRAERQVAPWKVPGRVATFDGAIIWPVQFAAHGRVQVLNTFSFGGFSSNGPFRVLDTVPPTYPRARKAFRFWTVRRPDERKDDLDYENAIVGWVAYITTTGRTWNGPIGDATISIQLPPWLQENPHFAIPLPQGYGLYRDRVVWHFTNYTPREEVVLYFIRGLISGDSSRGPVGFQYADQARAWVEFSARSSVAPEVIDQLIAASSSSEVKTVLQQGRVRLQRRPTETHKNETR